MLSLLLLWVMVLVVSKVAAYDIQILPNPQRISPHDQNIDGRRNRRGRGRRDFLSTTTRVVSIALGSIALPIAARAAEGKEYNTIGSFSLSSSLPSSLDEIKNEEEQEERLESLYVGCGCFWHLQHSIAVYERDILGRKGSTFTCQTGYAGGNGGTDEHGRVCYHNSPGNIGDCSKLGHGEVVNVQIPSARLLDFIQNLYLNQFDSKTHDRIDPMDIGPEYRNIIGLSNGTNHPLYSSITKIAKKSGYILKAGSGSDPDTLDRNGLIHVYDTKIYPFYQAEIYHQFHNDFQVLPYGTKYNNLANRALDDGRLHRVSCPDRITTF